MIGDSMPRAGVEREDKSLQQVIFGPYLGRELELILKGDGKNKTIEGVNKGAYKTSLLIQGKEEIVVPYDKILKALFEGGVIYTKNGCIE